MLYLAFIYHMHQPYYKNLLTEEARMPWVRLHGIKDYLDMVLILDKYPAIHQTFNMVPSLMEQVEDYTSGKVKDKFLSLSYKAAAELTAEDKSFIFDNFFMINKEKVIAYSPRYYELFFKKEEQAVFTTQDFLDLQVWFNLAWTDPYFRENIPALKNIVRKARFFNEEDKRIVLDEQVRILGQIIPAYRKFMDKGQIEVTLSPYYHPILPLLYNTNIAKEAYSRAALPKVNFSYPLDAKKQIDDAVSFYENKLGARPVGMWPSEEAVSKHILPFIRSAGINWIVTDEAILFKSIKRKFRDTKLIYKPHRIDLEEGSLHIVFRDRNLSDLIGFEYHQWDALAAANDFMKHMKNIAGAFKDEDILVTIAMDGENAWEYFVNDGHDFLNLLYTKLSEADYLKTTTVSEYLKFHESAADIRRLGAGSWIYGNFGKWIGSPYKNKAWEYLAAARKELGPFLSSGSVSQQEKDLAIKQMQICEGSDWFWWYGDNHDGFDCLFREHLANFYTIIGKEAPDYLKKPLTP